MRKVFVMFVVVSLLTVSSATADFINTYLDLNAIDNTYFNVDDGITEAFNEFFYFAETNSEISNTGVVVDSGRAVSTGLNTVSGNFPGDVEGEGSLWGIAFLWDDLTGQVTSDAGGVIEAIYTSGTFDFYLDFDPFAVDLGNDSTLTDGTKIATVELTSGSYRLDTTGQAGSSYIIQGNFTFLYEDFWFNAENGDDLSETDPLSWVFAYTAGDNDPAAVDITYNPDGSLSIFSTHDSSVSIGVVPEPSTIILLGAGLLGLLGLNRKKIFKK